MGIHIGNKEWHWPSTARERHVHAGNEINKIKQCQRTDLPCSRSPAPARSSSTKPHGKAYRGERGTSASSSPVCCLLGRALGSVSTSSNKSVLSTLARRVKSLPKAFPYERSREGKVRSGRGSLPGRPLRLKPRCTSTRPKLNRPFSLFTFLCFTTSRVAPVINMAA